MNVESVSYTYTERELRVLCHALDMGVLPGLTLEPPDDAMWEEAETGGLVARLGDENAVDRLAAFLVGTMRAAGYCICFAGDTEYLGLFLHPLASIVIRTERGRWVLTPFQKPLDAMEEFVEHIRNATWARSVTWGREIKRTEQAGADRELQLERILTALNSPFEEG